MTEMGLRFEKFSEITLHFFFGNGVMIAVFQADGIFPSESYLLKIKLTIGAISTAHSLRSQYGMSSGPEDVFLMDINILQTSKLYIVQVE